jgi:hypothetical protein
LFAFGERDAHVGIEGSGFTYIFYLKKFYNIENLTTEDIKYADRCFKHWHNTMDGAFGSRFLSFKAHQLLHLKELSLRHGSCVHRTCFTGIKYNYKKQ